MKLKTTIFFITFLTAGAFVGYFPKTTTATGSTNTAKKEYAVNMTVYCPVVGTGNVTENLIQSDDAAIYKHCSKCATGAYLLHKEGNQSLISKCTFCGALEENQEIYSISGE